MAIPHDNTAPPKKTPVAVPKKKAPGKPRTFKAPSYQLTPEQWAQRRTNQIISASSAPIAAQGERQAAQAQAAAEAYARLMKPTAGLVQNTFERAAQSQAGLAKGYSQAVQEMLGGANDQSNQLLAAVGGTQADAMPAQPTADVLYGLGGSLPAQEMGNVGAAFAAAARFLPKAAQLTGQGWAAQARQEAADKIAEIQGKRPELWAQALEAERTYRQGRLSDSREWFNTQQDNEINARAQALYEKQWALTQRGDVADITGVDPITGLPTADAVADQTATDVGTYIDAKGRRVKIGYRWNDKTGQVERIPSPGSSGSAASRNAKLVDKRNAEMSDTIVDVGNWIEKNRVVRKRVQVGSKPVVAYTQSLPGVGSRNIYVKNGGGTTSIVGEAATTPVYAERDVPLTYSQAYTYAFNELTNRLAVYGVTKAKRQEMARRMMEQYGVKQLTAKPKPKTAKKPAKKKQWWERAADAVGMGDG